MRNPAHSCGVALRNLYKIRCEIPHPAGAPIFKVDSLRPMRYLESTMIPPNLLFPSIALVFLFLIVPMVRADSYEVLMVDIAGANDVTRIAEFEKDAEKFNALHNKGYSDARPYFSVLQMANEQVYFVFGYRGDVQGIHRRNYPGTIENLRRMKYKGSQKYPHMHWLPVAEIRRLLTAP